MIPRRIKTETSSQSVGTKIERQDGTDAAVAHAPFQVHVELIGQEWDRDAVRSA